ncbi:hypothetical protein AVEN_1245-1 [Araneus ventricosus]|uniref:Uncharacterized protein n=1 Tax=Araneus ventricosus TaxID=182803 RepID=A0A4Y2UV49_ARAVE|nr:hypothetical protein AVEN_1245-1 [Araneus ventricosus]
MSDVSTKTACKDSFDAIVETGCTTTFFKFQWTAKDLTKYPTDKHPYDEYASSPVLYPLKSQSCKFEICNLRGERGYGKPELVMNFSCKTMTYITLNLSFSDTNGEVLCKIEKDLKFNYNRYNSAIEIEELARKILKMSEDTVIITCEMKISQIQSVLQTF